MRKIFC